MSDEAWVFVDSLVAVAILAVALAFLFPSVEALHRVLMSQEATIQKATEAGLDPWQEYR